MVTLLLLAAAAWFTKTNNKKTPVETILFSPPKDTLALSDSICYLPDSTRAFLIGNTRITPVKKREIQVDGTAFLEVPEASQPLVIQTKLLTLSVSDKAAFLIMAPSSEEWAELQIVEGTIIAKKAYPSEFDKPDTLHGNQMLMLNRTIDLMEKEKLDATDLKAWRARLP